VHTLPCVHALTWHALRACLCAQRGAHKLVRNPAHAARRRADAARDRGAANALALLVGTPLPACTHALLSLRERSHSLHILAHALTRSRCCRSLPRSTALALALTLLLAFLTLRRRRA
jgi:hypothetical protein